MLKNYVKIALRNLLKQKVYSFINVFGLAIGIACCILIFTYIRHEWSYDRFHENANRIYRVTTTTKAPDGERFTHALQPVPMGRALKDEYPEVDQAIRFIQWSSIVSNENTATGEDVTFADAGILEVFTLPFRLGNPETAFKEPNSIVVSAKIAHKYFGDEDPIEKMLSVQMQGEKHPYLVTGVLQPIPDNSSIQLDILLPFEQYPFYDNYVDNWNSSRTNTYVQLLPNTNAAHLESKFPPLVTKYLGSRIAENQDTGELSQDADAWVIGLQPLKDVHLDPNVKRGMVPASNPIYSLILGGIALLVLLIACINFMTLAIGRSTNRAGEVGIRKVMGAVRVQLVKQFLGEALLLSVLALLVGIAIAELFLPHFNSLASRELRIEYGANWPNWVALLGLVLFVGFVAGSYPSIILSRFQPVDVLKGHPPVSPLSKGGLWGIFASKKLFTRSLVVLQYALSVFLMISATIMSKQLHYLSSKDLGYHREQVVVLETYAPWGSGEGKRLLEIMRAELSDYSKVLNVSGTAFAFAKGSNQEGWQSGLVTREAYVYRVDYNYLETLDIELMAGRGFSVEFSSDPANSVIVNETLVKEFGYGSSEEAVGKRLIGYKDGKDLEDPAIIGVVRDYHFASLRSEIAPALLHCSPSWPISQILIRITPHDMPAALAQLENIWAEITPGTPFEYSFMDEDIDKLYHSEDRWGRIVRYSAVLAILIACLGIFGMATITSSQRTKEIGVRKVLGASVSGIVRLLSKEYILISVLAGILSFPLAFFVIARWLDNFAYRVEIGPGIFAYAALLSVLIAFLTVFYHALRAALANPIDSLRYE